MRLTVFVARACIWGAASLLLSFVGANARATAEPRAASGNDKPWCAPEVTELSEHVCFFDGGAGTAGRKTLVIYLHGSLVATPGFQYVQQRMMARQARQGAFTVVIPTSPKTETGYWWPSGADVKLREPAIVDGIRQARADIEKKLNTHFDATFVVGFSSGAYYASSLSVRSALDVDGYIILAGGSSWVRPVDSQARRAPVFVGVSAADKQTAEHSRAFAGTLAALGWPYRVEERPVGHLVDDVFLAHGLAYLRGRMSL